MPLCFASICCFLFQLKLLNEQQSNFIHCADIEIENLDQINCLGAPFFPEGQRHNCTCNELIQGRFNEAKLNKKEKPNISYDEEMDDCSDEKEKGRSVKKSKLFWTAMKHLERSLLVTFLTVLASYFLCNK